MHECVFAVDTNFQHHSLPLSKVAFFQRNRRQHTIIIGHACQVGIFLKLKTTNIFLVSLWWWISVDGAGHYAALDLDVVSRVSTLLVWALPGIY
jgi:hypothetical protein